MPNENATAPNGTTEAPAGGEQQQNQQQQPQVPAWVPEPLRGHKSLTKFKDPGALAESYVNLEKMVGNRVEVPADDAPAEVKAAWRTKIGVPATADEYDAPSVPEGITLDSTVVSEARKQFHELGIPKTQAKKLMDWYIVKEIERTNTILQERAEQHQQGMAALEKRWGAAAPRQIALCHRVVAELGGESVKKVLDETGAGNDPALVEFLAKIGGMMEEDKLIMPVQVGQSKEQAIAEIAKIRAERAKDKKHPLNDKKNPGHAEAVKHFHGLYQIAYPEMQSEDGT